MHKVFVYGSLLSEMGNHGLLSNSLKIGDAISPKGFKMVSLGYFPGVFKSEDGAGDIVGEIYEVDDNTLRSLDRLEGYNSINPEHGFYNRIEIDTNFGKAFMYTIGCSYIRNHDFVENGDWRTHYNSKLKKYQNSL